jgi:uncharacterized coiled-coil protein SlyX
MVDLENRIAELEAKLESLHKWTSKKMDELEDRVNADLRVLVRKIEQPKPKNNSKANLWSDEEKNYLASRLTGLESPRPILISLSEKWEEKFGKSRSYDSLRKMWSRLKT